jgi:hypothetical protein
MGLRGKSRVGRYETRSTKSEIRNPKQIDKSESPNAPNAPGQAVSRLRHLDSSSSVIVSDFGFRISDFRRHPTPNWRLRNLTCGLLALLLLAAACQGQEEPTGAERGDLPKGPRFNVDFTAGWDGCYRPLEWTPVEIGITCNMKDPVGGRLSVSAQQDSLSTLSITHPVVLQKDHPVTLPLVMKLAPGASTCDVALTDERGREMWAYQYPLQNFGGNDSRNLKAVGTNDALIGLVGRRGFGLIRLGEGTVSANGNGRGRVYVKDKLPQYLSWDWTGYASLDLLILYDPEWDKINVHQAQAIAQWVSNGGKLLVVLGSRPLPAGHPIAEMLPLAIGLPQKLNVVAADAPFAPEARPARGAEPETTSVTAWALADVRDKSWKLERFGLEPVLAGGQVGFGRAAVLLFDPSELTGTLAASPDRLWAWALKGLTGERVVTLGEPPAESTNNFIPQQSGGTGQAGQATNRVLEHLLQIPELRPLSIWWVIGLLTLLALLLGPVDYLVLKRLDRLPMTWVTSSVIIAVFTAGAYYGVQALRAGSTQVRSVTVTDGIAGGPAWATSYSGIFASSSDDYALEGLQGNQWWSGIAPSREEDQFGGRGEDFSTRRIFCKQIDGGNLPYSLPISIWSMQCLVAEWPVAQMPFSAEVTVDDGVNKGNQVTVDIDNKSSSPMRNAWVDVGMYVAHLGEVPAKSKVTLRAGLYLRLNEGYEFEKGNNWDSGAINSSLHAQGTNKRTTAMNGYLQKEAAVVCAVYDSSPCCCQVADAKNNTNHVHVVRLVVWPKRVESQ